MRTAVILLLASVMVAAGSQAAHGSPQFQATFSLDYLSGVPGASTGQSVLINWSDPGEPHGIPKVIRSFTLKFQLGTRFDTSALARCRVSDAVIKAQGLTACPRDTRLGSGGVVAITPTGAQLKPHVTLFNAKDRIIVLVTLGRTVVSEFRDEVHGATIKVRPILPIGVSLQQLALRIGPHSTGRGASKRVYMRSPPACPAGGRWTVSARFTYVDGSSQALASDTPCGVA